MHAGHGKLDVTEGMIIFRDTCDLNVTIFFFTVSMTVSIYIMVLLVLVLLVLC